jgi:hypothetical protein
VPSTAICRFTNTSDYEGSLRELSAIMTPTRPGPFSASVVRADLSLIRLMRLQETAPRIAFLSIPEGWRYSVFLLQPGPRLIWNGEALSIDDLMLTGNGEHFHQRTSDAASIGVIGIPARMLEHYASGLMGPSAANYSEASIVSLQAPQKRRLLRLHDRICRLVETRPTAISHSEVARAIEHELIEALVICLMNGDVRRTSLDGRTIGQRLAMLESLLAQASDQLPSTRDMCAALGISEAVLQSCCATALDMSFGQYAELCWAKLRKTHGER